VDVITHIAQQACTHVQIPTESEMKIEIKNKTPSLGACLSLSPVINLRAQSPVGTVIPPVYCVWLFGTLV
jgi:hypothetical protein